MSGTVVMSGDRKFVKIDGSDALTPVFETVDIQEGDRVYVSIENHQASVIGNYSYPPSARVANQANAMAEQGILKVDGLIAVAITTENLTAHSATITNLVAQNINAGYAKITELDALKGNIETLSGDVLNYKNATFEQLNAANGRIDNLSGDVLNYKNATFEQLEAAEGKITKLEGDVVSYKNATFEELEATKGQIDELNGNFISYKEAVFEQLEAAEGKITNLEGDYLEYKQAVLNELQAQDAIITNLSGDFASYKEVMAGELVAAKGWMLDGSIGNAQISNLDATKITSGIIDTSLITVKGSDGKLQIIDNTIQISDSNRVRVQIGKDSSNDYSMSVWDQNGLLIWDALGATENTIQRKIIRDKMVADDAAIQALKIDFKSFETALTNQGVTISGTVVQVGNKTLNVELSEQRTLITYQGELLSDHSSQIEANETAIGLRVTSQEYETYKSSVNGQLADVGSRMTSAESSITTMQGQISLKVEQTDIESALSNYSTTKQMQTAIDLSKTSILSSVSETYALQTDVAKALNAANSKNKTYEGEGSPNYTGEGNIVAQFTNKVPTSISENGSVFNGTGYQNDMRVRSGGALTGHSGFVATGFIPVKAGDVIRFTCDNWATANSGSTINFGYISSGAFTSIGSYTTQPATYGIYQDSSKVNSDNIPSEESPGIWKVTVPNDSSITYLRMSCYGTGADLIVTVNEEIAYGEQGATGNPNSPSVAWKTEGSEADHVGDLYLDTETGYLYRWGLYDGVYSWKMVNESFETWKSEASQLITKDGIISTVGNYYAYTDDLDAATGRITAAESKIEQHADSITSIVEDGGVISLINQTAGSVKIDAAKINLNGYVTMSDLSTAGKTTIVGDNITSGTITGIAFVGATGDFTGSVTATNLIAVTTGKLSIFDFNEYGMSVDFTGNNVKDYAFSKDYFCARVFNKSNVERAYFYMDTEDSIPGINGRAIVYAHDEISLRVPSTGVVTVTNESTVVKTIYINPNGDIFKNGYNLALSNGSKTIILRNDTSYFRILIGDDLTDNTFTWNSLRPFNIDLSNGKVSINNGLEASSVVATTFQAGNSTTNGGIELYHSTPFIDFHFGRDTSDFTARLIEEEKGILRLVGAFRVSQVIHMGPTNGGYERSIRFNVTTGTYQHHASLYGGNPGSTTAIGCYDNKNGRRIWAYNDVDNILNVTPSINTGSHDGSYNYCLKGGAALNVHTAGGSANFNALARIRATAGAWMLGVLNSSNAFQLAYGNESIVTGTTNATTCLYSFSTSGEFGANKIRVLNSGTTESNVIVSNGGITGNLAASGASRLGIYNNTASKWVIYAETTNMIYIGDRVVVPYTGAGGIRANATDASYDCGHTSYLWGTVYAKNGVKTTSDEREKDIMSLELSELSDYFMSIKPIAFRWKYGNDKKIHLGVGAQTTERKMIEAGYDPSLFDMIQHDNLEVVSDSGLMERYGINYQDLNMLTMMQTQKNAREIQLINVDLSLFKDEQDELKEEVQNLKIELALANQKIAELSAKTA